jgi:hypothetical protein
MIQKFFSGLYELLIGRPMPPAYTMDYRTVIFPNVGLQLLIITLALVLIYYYVFNRVISTGWYKTQHWVLFMVINAGIAAGLPFYHVLVNNIEMHTYAKVFAFLNTCYSVILFVGFSLALKKWSVQAWTTPVKWPNKK